MFVVSLKAAKLAATVVLSLASVAALGYGAYRVTQSQAARPAQASATMPEAQQPRADAGRVAVVAPPAAGGAPENAAPPAAAPPAAAPAAPPAAAPAAPAPPPSAPPAAQTVAREAAPAAAADAARALPRFDIVRVERSGELVVAGQASAGATVELLADGRKFDRAVADLSGQWVMVPKPLAPGTHELSLRSITPAGAAEQSPRTVTVLVPSMPAGDLLVTLNEPDKATQILQSGAPPPPTPRNVETRPGERAAEAPGAAAPPPAREAPAPGSPPASTPPQMAAVPPAASEAPAGAPAPRARRAVSITTAEMDESGRFFASGSAAKGATLRLYLNDSYIATARAGDEERWSFTIQRGLSSGDYVVRVDDVTQPEGRVLSRAEVPFRLAAVVAAAPAAVPPATSPPAAVPSAAAAPVAATPPAAAPPAVPPAPAAPVIAPPPASAPPVATAPTAGATPPASAPAVAAAPAPAAPGPSSAPPADVVVADVRSAVVRKGDSLWRISRQAYGRGARYTAIFEANTAQIRDPARIYPGQVFVVPNEAVN